MKQAGKQHEDDGQEIEHAPGACSGRTFAASVARKGRGPHRGFLSPADFTNDGTKLMTESAKANSAVRLVDAAELRLLTVEAANAPRRRSHLLLHEGPDDQVQRLLIAAQPGTYVRPHHHSRQWELLILQSGAADILILGQAGEVLSRSRLDRTSPMVQIPVSAWHTCVVHEPDTVIIEVKPGPYRPNEFADWAPEEGNERAAPFVHWATRAEIGQTWAPEGLRASVV
ncbi:MAG TPA: WbuC family cupin fold metalloprotein [Rhodoplanes sp.]|nr:WbuC family cupin fold metalloprotein [Rhodoplanes sp.]